MAGLLLADVIAKGASARDLSDDIALVEAESYPLTSAIPKTTQDNANVLMEWPVDKLDAPKDAATIEKDFTEFAAPFQNFGLLQNRTQYCVRGPYLIGHRADGSQNLAGYKRKVAQALAKGVREHKRDLEILVSSEQEAQVGNGTDVTPDKSRMIGKYISATAQSVYPVPDAHLVPSASIYSGTLSALTERGTSGSVQSVFGSMYGVVQNRITRTLVVGKDLKAKFSDFNLTPALPSNTAVARRIEGDPAKIDVNVEVYSNDTGMAELLVTPFLNWTFNSDKTVTDPGAASANYGYALDLSNWNLFFKKRPQARPLPDLGAGERFVVESELGLKCLNPRGEGAFKITS